MRLFKFIVLIGLGVVLGQSPVKADCGTLSFDIGSDTIYWSTDVDFMTAGCPQPFVDPIAMDVFYNLLNATVLVFDEDLTIDGSMNFTNNGNAAVYVPDTVVLTINGNAGDQDNNNVTWDVDGMVIIQDTLFGKNNNGFQGTGSISGGYLSVKNGTSCGTPCPAEGGFDGCGSGDSFCDDNSILPVELLFFSGKGNENGVHLDWATASEDNFHYFSIQRSGKDLEFGEIGRVVGVGYSTTITNYSFEDPNPLPGLFFYRLKAVDFDGTFEIFQVISVEFQAEQVFKITPTLVSSNSYLQVFNYLESDTPSNLALIDATGRQVYAGQIHPGVNHVSLTMIAPGLYIARISAPGGIFSERILVQ